jgi:threonine-phosphate decarboxylase
MIHVVDAATWRISLLERAIAVRDCTSFGLPEWVRVAVRTPAENERLVEALVAVRATRADEVAG